MTTEDMLNQIERNLDAREARRAARANGGRAPLRLMEPMGSIPTPTNERPLTDTERIERSLASIRASLARFDARRDGKPLLRLVD